ncbi:hypothetical protein B4Q13_20865, partial [Lacticaseibacillus rhamnosus]
MLEPGAHHLGDDQRGIGLGEIGHEIPGTAIGRDGAQQLLGEPAHGRPVALHGALRQGRVDQLAQAAMGPFYCPGDEKLYIDLSFYEDLKTRFKAPGDFAQAYVIAHEGGHHIQKLTGTFSKLEDIRGRVSKAEYNQTSVRMELQADCYAGIWGHFAAAKNQLDPGDIEEALTAA